MDNRKKIVWNFISIIIAALTIWAVISESKYFSASYLISRISNAKIQFLALAIVCMFGYIFFEGLAIIRIAKSLNYKPKISQGIVYGAADVYFSSITPSATGGQPASAYFMVNDGISGAAATIILLINLIMYFSVLLFIGLICLIFHFDIFLSFSPFAIFLISFGILILTTLAIILFLLLRRANIIYGIFNKIIDFLQRIHIIPRSKNLKDRMNKSMADYQKCAQIITNDKRLLIDTFCINILQRLSQLAVPPLIFISLGKSIAMSFDVFIIQCFVAIGSNCIPIPGAMGVADYLMLDGYTTLVGELDAPNLEILCRGAQFYLCIITSAIIVLLRYLMKRGFKK